MLPHSRSIDTFTVKFRDLRKLKSTGITGQLRYVNYDFYGRLRREMRCHMFGLTENNPRKFVTTSWVKSQVPFAVYRVLTFVHAISILIWRSYEESIKQDAETSWIIRFPTWSFILYSVYHTLSLIMTILEFFHDLLCNDDLSWYHKVCWLLQTITFNSSVLCLIGSLVYTIAKATNNARVMDLSIIFSSDDVNLNTIGGMVMIIDVFVTNATMRLLHVVYPIVYTLFFFAFHIYRWSGGYTPDYVALDYGTHPSTAIPYVFVIVFLFCPCVHALAYAIDTLRWKLLLTCIERHRRRLIEVTTALQGFATVGGRHRSVATSGQNTFPTRAYTPFNLATPRYPRYTHDEVYPY